MKSHLGGHLDLALPCQIISFREERSIQIDTHSPIKLWLFFTHSKTSHMVQIGLPDLLASAHATNHNTYFESLWPDTLFSFFITLSSLSDRQIELAQGK